MLLLGGYRKLVDAAVAELEARGHPDVSPALHYAMSAIDLGATTATEPGRALAVSKQAAGKTIAVLEERGYVAVEPDPGDGRRKILRVTELGHAVTRAGEEIFDELRQAWIAQAGADEVARLERTLAALVGDDGVRLDAPGWRHDEG